VARRFPAGQWSIDFPRVDEKTGDFVVVELKRGKSSDAVMGQLARYMMWVTENLAKPGQKVRGIIVRTDAHPLYLGLSAIGYQRLFKVVYQEANLFRLLDDDRALATVLAEHPGLANDEPPPRSPVDPLASEIEQTCPDVWISVGSGQTAYNFYVSGPSGDALIIGLYESGELWTDIAALGSERAARFAVALARTGVAIDEEKKWCIWKKYGMKVNLGDLDVVAVAEAVRAACAATEGAEAVCSCA
jgi:hypothetical protein